MRAVPHVSINSFGNAADICFPMTDNLFSSAKRRKRTGSSMTLTVKSVMISAFVTSNAQSLRAHFDKQVLVTLHQPNELYSLTFHILPLSYHLLRAETS
jgi:hypothetical protein